MLSLTASPSKKTCSWWTGESYSA